jgi:putative drug exporter of the RND superfamily
VPRVAAGRWKHHHLLEKGVEVLQRIITYVTRRPKRVIALWLVAVTALATVGASQSYRVTTDDMTEFLPEGSESAVATHYAQDAFGQQKGTYTVTALVERADGGRLTRADRAAIGALSERLGGWKPDASRLDVEGAVGDLDERAGRIVAASPGPVAPDGRFQLVGLQWKANTTDPVAQEAFRQLRDRTADDARAEGLRVGFTSGIASLADFQEATEGTRSLSQALLFGSILLLSLLFFRGPLAAVVPVLAIALVAAGASGLVVLAALAFDFQLDTSTPQLITVVLVGIGVDYFLFLLFRLRERLRAGEDRRTAAASAAGSVGPVIASAALAIVAAFATMAFAEFGQFQVIGPAVAISVLVMLLAGVTLMPAIAAVTGRALFWPSSSWALERSDGPAARLGRRIARTPGRAALAVTTALVMLSAFAAGTQMSYDSDDSGPSTPATRTADRISAALSEGASDPQQVYVKSTSGALSLERLRPLREGLAAIDGVSSVGEPALTPDRHGARIDMALADGPFTKGSMDLIRGPIRRVARETAPAGTTAMVGGTSAIFADVSDSVARDMALIFPIAAGLILAILVFTLRSLVAPLYLLAAVALEFAATLGASVLVVQELGGKDGVTFTLPLVLFLFVVALGTDYNILMTARLREEMLAGTRVRDAVADAVRHVAPAVGAAGLVLASSFGTLMLESGETSREMGFAMAFGILLASLVVSSILVPALTALAGTRAWWPGRGTREPRAVTMAEPEAEKRVLETV